MAILSKIRERSTFLILIIGLALFAFVLDPKSIQKFFDSTNINEIGKIGDDIISRKEYSDALEAYRAQYGSRVTEMQASNDVWNMLVRQKIYENQLKNAGITVGENDVWNAVIESPSITTNQQFQNKAGLFDQDKLKEYLATIKQDPNQQTTWIAWTNYMARIKNNLENQTYNNLITAGLGASLSEGKTQYFYNNTKIKAQYVFVPYNTVADSLVKVTKSEIESYIQAHESIYKVDETRDLLLVKFPLTPTAEDETAIKDQVAALIKDDGQIKGFKNTTNMADFFVENNADIPLDNSYNFKNTVSVAIADAVFKGKKGDVFGPYKDRGYFKISKITEVVQMPDSVKGAHILVPFVGSVSADKNTTKTAEQAKKSIDSILSLVKRNKKKFADIANKINPDGTKGKGGEIGWVTKDQAYSPNFDKDFADFLFFHKKGTIQVVKTKFGYHIIRIDDSKNKQQAVKLATFAKKIVASQATENVVFQKAETFALSLSKGQSITDLVKKDKLTVQPVIGLKSLDENVPGVGRQRAIVQWAFNKENKVGAFKRFDITNGYVVAMLNQKTAKGLMPAAKAASSIRPILTNRKKAAIISQKMKGTTLDAIAKNMQKTVKTASDVALQSPVISGVGFEPKIVGAMYGAKENKLYTKVAGAKGVFAFQVTKKELPIDLPNYNTYRKQLEGALKSRTNLMYNAIKNATDIKDNRAALYGINK